MAKRIVAYVIGAIVIVVGVLFLTEASLQSMHTQNKPPNIDLYPMIGFVLVVAGAVFCYIGYRSGRVQSKDVQ